MAREHQARRAANVTVRNIITQHALDVVHRLARVLREREPGRRGAPRRARVRGDGLRDARRLPRTQIESSSRGSRTVRNRGRRPRARASARTPPVLPTATARGRSRVLASIAEGRPAFEARWASAAPAPAHPARVSRSRVPGLPRDDRGADRAVRTAPSPWRCGRRRSAALATGPARRSRCPPRFGDRGLAIVHRRGADPAPAAAARRSSSSRTACRPRCARSSPCPPLLTRRADVEEQLERLEVHYLANPEGHLHFALLTDWTDARTEHMPDDDRSWRARPRASTG